MQKSFSTIEDLIADESFLSWYHGKKDEKSRDWVEWLNSNPGYQSMVSQAIEFMDGFDKEARLPEHKIDQAFARLEKGLREKTATVVDLQPSRKRWWMAAAAVIVFALGIFAYMQLTTSKSIIQTQYGQMSKQQLPDGSQVMLNANTKVTLGKGWDNGNDREVWLKGEAFFQVAKTPKKTRFIVHTDQLDIIVTGTQFNVRSHDHKTSVLLTEGSVVIKTHDHRQISLRPGDFVEISNENPGEKIATVDQESILAWKESKLNFDNTPMREVAKMITHHYGLKVTLSDSSVASKTITGMMPNNNLDDLLAALEATTDFRITKTDTTIVISKP